MKKATTILALALLIALCGCTAAGGTNAPSETGQGEEPMKIAVFEFTHTGMSTAECYLYSAEKMEEGMHLYTEELFAGGYILDTVTDGAAMEQLEKLVHKHRLDRWNGFDKSKKNVSDGSRFSLSIVFENGESISASGSNAFPEGYAEAEADIRALFEALIDQYEISEP